MPQPECIRDFKLDCYRFDSTDDNPQFTGQQTVVSDGTLVATGFHRQGKDTWLAKPEMHDRIALSPERILLTADRADDLGQLSDVHTHGVLHHHLRFTWNGFPIDIFVNVDTFLPDRIESVRSNPFEIPQNALGDISWRTDFLFWKREPTGLVYPHQWNSTRNGKPIAIDSVIGLTQRPALTREDFDIPSAAQTQFASRGHLPVDQYPFDGDRSMDQIADNVWLISIMECSGG